MRIPALDTLPTATALLEGVGHRGVRSLSNLDARPHQLQPNIQGLDARVQNSETTHEGTVQDAHR
jgi:hypothetical protein